MTSTRNDSRNEHRFQQFVQPTGSAYMPNPTVRLTGAACEANPTALAYGLYVTLFAVVHGDLSVELTDRSQGRDVAEVRKLLPRIRLDMTPYHPPVLY